MLNRRSTYKTARAPRFNADLIPDSILTLTHNQCQIPASLVNVSEGGLALKVPAEGLQAAPQTFLDRLEFKALGKTYFSDAVRVAHIRREESLAVLGVSTEGKRIAIEDLMMESQAWREAAALEKRVAGRIRRGVRPEFEARVLKLASFFEETAQALLEWEERDRADWFALQRSETLTLKNFSSFFKQETQGLLQAMARIYEELSENEKEPHRAFFRERLQPFFLQAPFAKRAWEKPFGYPGDYIMMNMMYDREFLGETPFARLIHWFLASYIPGTANVERLEFLIQKIREKAAQRIEQGAREVRFLSLGSGPGREIETFVGEHAEADLSTFTCVDWEDEALDYARKRIVAAKQETRRKTQLNFIHGDVIAIVRDNPVESMQEQDLIYSTGLFDYLSDAVAMRLIKQSYGLLKKGGEMLVVNASPQDPSAMETEYIGDWLLTRRSEQELRNLASFLPPSAPVTITLDGQGVYHYMTIVK